ncbi:MAG: DUF4143 domain-containing protein, partial [Bacteroidetes bacterium]|nr:DUF4143 domain-containing protein [Bacteroidota bacterium]
LRKDRPLFGHLLESFVFQELRRLASFAEHRHRFHHFGDKDKKEVDVVIERSWLPPLGFDPILRHRLSEKSPGSIMQESTRFLRIILDIEFTGEYFVDHNIRYGSPE